MTNIAAYIEQIARHYWGEPKEKRGHELRWGTHGSRSVDLRKGTWFDFEANEGGGEGGGEGGQRDPQEVLAPDPLMRDIISSTGPREG